MIYKIKKNANKNSKIKYPYMVYLDNGITVPVPSQHKFSSSFISKHGCSLVGFYMAVRFLGIKRNMKQCKDYMNKYFPLNGRSKFSINKVYKAINKISSGTPAKFIKKASKKDVIEALKDGHMVLFEERDPIHTAVLLMSKDGKTVRRFSDGGYKTVTVQKEIDKRCGDSHYGGCVIVKYRKKKK